MKWFHNSSIVALRCVHLCDFHRANADESLRKQRANARFYAGTGAARARTRELTCRLTRNIAITPSMYSVLEVWAKTMREGPRSSRLFVMIMITRSESVSLVDNTAEPLWALPANTLQRLQATAAAASAERPVASLQGLRALP